MQASGGQADGLWGCYLEAMEVVCSGGRLRGCAEMHDRAQAACRVRGWESSREGVGCTELAGGGEGNGNGGRLMKEKADDGRLQERGLHGWRKKRGTMELTRPWRRHGHWVRRPRR